MHRAGGRAFLAHPLVLEPDVAKLDALVARLKALGLDGLEALYEPFTEDDRRHLCEMAQRHDLLLPVPRGAHRR